MSQLSGSKKPKGKTTTVTKEDQDKINRFARLNSKHVDICSDVSDKERELENFQEATSAVEELELTADGDTTGVPYRVGDVFLNVSFEEALSRLETDKQQLNEKKNKKGKKRKNKKKTELNFKEESDNIEV